MNVRDADRPPVLAHLRFAVERASFHGLGLRERFERIHAINLWGAASSSSGLGSEQTAVSALSAGLPTLLRELSVSSLLDAPCGDAQWINRLGLELDYTGVDIVPEIVRSLQQRAAAREIAGRYLQADITTDPLPRADAVLCRDCLVHLSFAHIERAVRNLRRSGATWLITTTFSALRSNHDCEDGDWRPLNLCRPPFGWPAPAALLDERCDEAGGGYRDKSLGVWRLDSL
ncbi:MAG TPA: class I SAM-dependent methyltransferase [Burkholderiaceae bacterium]|nr:class I SAM-dependent methyltransferase [Burkholderiaceae bacterium]